MSESNTKRRKTFKESAQVSSNLDVEEITHSALDSEGGKDFSPHALQGENPCVLSESHTVPLPPGLKLSKEILKNFPLDIETQFREYLKTVTEKSMLMTDEKIDEIRNLLSAGNQQTIPFPPGISTTERQRLSKERYRFRKMYFLEGNTLYKRGTEKNRVVASYDTALGIILSQHEFPENGQIKHPLLTETSTRVKNVSHGIQHEHIKWLLDKCQKCHAPPKPINDSASPEVEQLEAFERVQIDFLYVGQLQKDKYKWVLIIRDHFSNFTALYALQQRYPELIMKCLIEIVEFYGPPKVFQYEPSKLIDCAIAFLLNHVGFEVKIAQKRESDVAHRATCMKRVVYEKIKAWLQAKSGRKWKKSLDCVERSINAEQQHGTPFSSANGILFGPQRAKSIKETAGRMSPKDPSLGKTDLKDFIHQSDEDLTVAEPCLEEENIFIPQSCLDAFKTIPVEEQSNKEFGLPSLLSIKAALKRHELLVKKVIAHQEKIRQQKIKKHARKYGIPL